MTRAKKVISKTNQSLSINLRKVLRFGSGVTGGDDGVGAQNIDGVQEMSEETIGVQNVEGEEVDVNVRINTFHSFF